MSTGIEHAHLSDLDHRRQSHGQIEISGPNGRRKTVDLSELSEADRQLAEEFGYKPVKATHDWRERLEIEEIEWQC